MIQLQTLNGNNLGIGLRSQFSATNLIEHIAYEMRYKICTHIKQIEGKISILLDESTTLSNLTCLIIYLRCETTKDNPPHYLFLDLVELENQTSATIVNTILTCLNKYEFDEDFLMRNLVAISTDGASVMLGRKCGVATTLARKFPNIITWHCLNHRLELAVSDAIRENKAVNHFQILFDKLYSIYSRSPKNKRKLSECSKEIDIQLQKIGRMFSVRWVASSYRTVAAVWNNFKPLCLHFESTIRWIIEEN